MNYANKLIDKVAEAIYLSTYPDAPYSWAQVAAFTDDEGMKWAAQLRASAVAALNAIGLEEQLQDARSHTDTTTRRYVTPWRELDT